MNTLNVTTKETDFAAHMVDGHSQFLTESTEPSKICVGSYQNRLPFAACDSSAYDIVLGKKRRDEYNALIKKNKNKISFKFDNNIISITASFKKSQGRICTQGLAQDLVQAISVFVA